MFFVKAGEPIGPSCGALRSTTPGPPKWENSTRSSSGLASPHWPGSCRGLGGSAGQQGVLRRGASGVALNEGRGCAVRGVIYNYKLPELNS